MTTIGQRGEDIAAEFLSKAGMRIIARNYRCGHGELDIVARDGDAIVFVEVKTRCSAAFGAPEQAITPAKQRQLVIMANRYLYRERRIGTPCRFDVVAVELRNGRCVIRHIPNAFLSCA
jgi:putative endonuclease